MEKNILITCDNGHPAEQLCVSEKCTSSSAACNTNNCQYSTAHKRCFFFNALQLIHMLLQKAKRGWEDINQLILESIDRQVKELDIMKQEYLRKIQACRMGLLEDEERKLFLLFKNQETKNLEPKFVFTVISNLEHESKMKSRVQNELEKAKKIMKEMEEQQLHKLVEIRQLWMVDEMQVESIQEINIQNVNPYFFDQNMLNTEIITIINNRTSIKKVNQKGNWNFSLISPLITEANYQKIRIKIQDLGDQALLGVATKSSMQKSKWEWPGGGEGLYSIISSGFCINHSDKDQDYKFFNFGFRTGDEVEMEYKREENKLLLKNIQTGSSFQIHLPENIQKDLHYCVGLMYLDKEMEIVNG